MNEKYIENNLFDLKLMNQYIEKYENNLEITDEINKAVNKWISMINSKELESELKHHKDFHHIILEEILGYPYDSYKCEENIGNNKRPDVILYDNKKPYVACELKSTTTRFNKKEGMNAIDQVTLYASKKEETKWAIVSNYEEIRLFNPSYNEKYISFKFEGLTDTKILKKFLLVFSKFSLIDEKIPTKLLDETKIIQREFEDNFYELYCETRLMLIEEIKHQNDSFSNDEIINYAQLILNRYLFICFAEDLSIIPQVTKDTITTPIINENLFEDTIWQRLNELFRFIYKGNKKKQILSFEGDLFKDDLYGEFKICDFIKDPEEFFKDCYKKYKFNDKDVEIENILSIYDDDEKYDSINPIFRNLLLIASFDFSTELDVNILGHIFEKSIGTLDDILDETFDKDEEKDVDKNQTSRQVNGIFYTPEYVTNYMCKNTIISYLSKTSEALSIADLIQEYQDDDELDILDEKLKNIKILDPACGSGAFLNKAVDILLDIHQSIHDSKNYSKSNLDKWIDSIETRKNILQNNIYGVDLSENSVELTKLSLFLKLASSKNVKEGFKLPDLNNNIKCGNSVITRLFNWNEEFKEIMEEGGFDVIIGNPPYLGSNRKGEEYQKQREELNNSDEYETLHGKWDFYIAFIEKGLKLLKENGELSFIISNAYDHADFSIKSKKWIYNNYHFKQLDFFKNIKIFNDATVESTILTIQKNKNEEYTKKIIHYEEFNNIITSNVNEFDELFITNKIFDLKENIEEYNLLSEICFIGTGLRLNSSKKYEKEFNKTFKKYAVLSDIKTERCTRKYVENKFTEPYFIKKIKYVEYGTDLVPKYIYSKTFPELYIYPKIIFGEMSNWAIYDEDKLLCDNTCTVLVPHNSLKGVENRSINLGIKEANKIIKSHFGNEKNREKLELISKEFELKYILALLNSKAFRYYSSSKARHTVENRSYINDLRALPICVTSKEKQSIFIYLVDNIIRYCKEFIDEVNGFVDYLNHEYNTNITFFRLREDHKLKRYYNLDFDEFLEEVKKKSKPKSILKKRENIENLEDEFNKSKEILLPLKVEINKINNTINHEVYKLYNLSDEDIKIIEAKYSQTLV